MKVHLTTLGCPKNQVDSELMLGMLAAAGIEAVATPTAADCLVVNTCAFIERAREESVNAILELAQLRAGGRARSLIVTGCLSQRYGRELLAELPEVDAILGTGELERIVEVVRGRTDWVGPPTPKAWGEAPPGYLYGAGTPRLLAARVPYAYVKIAEGCDMGCAFCAIPQFRGNHRSRALRDIVTEVEKLATKRIREAILVSQDTLAYGKDLPGNEDIGDLLLALSDTPIPWIRPMYLHPAHVNDRLLAKWERARVLPYLDMPIQHADDGILRRMRRGVTSRRMKEIFKTFRQAIPGLTLRTTVLVGFPGESEAAFQHLLDFVEEVCFDRLGVFTYSTEEGTPAAVMADQVPPEVMAERARIVQDTQDRIAWELQKCLYGTVQTVLVDGPSEDPAFPWEGRMAGQAPEIDGVVYLRDRTLTPGQFARVRIVEVEGYELVGEPAD
ncbi:MAG: 30S ribosomal protein S12 methylthiotransferase RimO [Candidatus Rokubacteria bacterium]|nr:30S ribosomal protein S12 methylthiotransferase RimO [Candidatus Rokubacteria bacterium]